MITERGRICQLEDGRAWIECQSSGGCERCARGQGCGGGVLGALLGDRLHRVRASAAGHELRVGDQVEIGISETALVTGAVVVYGLPLAGLLGGAVGAGMLADFSSDGLTLAGALAGLALAVVTSRRLHWHGAGRFEPVITRNLGHCAGPGEAG